MFDHKALLGEEARINDDLEVIGIITDSYHVGQTHWLQIDGSYELAVQSVTVVQGLDLATDAESRFARLKAF